MEVPADSLFAGLPDSLAYFLMEPFEVEGEPLRPVSETGAIRIGGAQRNLRDATRLDGLAPLLPSTRLAVNSRGEGLFMLRGAPERHLPVFLDGIPLAQPWDERTDLSLLPLAAIETVTLRRGAEAFAWGPGALAGAVDLETGDLEAASPRTRLDLAGGEGGAWETSLTHRRSVGGTGVLLALSGDGRDGFILPASHDEGLHQPEARLRLNSDRRQNALILAAARRWKGGTALRAVSHWSRVRRGVPPEEHRENARFWRYPHTERQLFGISLEVPRGRFTRAEFLLSADRFRQDIRPYEDDAYAGPPLESGVDFEHGEDATLFARLGLRRERPGLERLTLKAELRDTRHRESLVLDGPVTEYRQMLASLLADMRLWRGPWTLELGAAAERAETPATGAHPDRGGIGAGRVRLAMRRSWEDGTSLFLATGRRSRFPSLRELYSGALGSFLPNPELEPERQDLLECGLRLRGSRWRCDLDLYAARVQGGIEKEILPDGLYQRVNRGSLLNLGMETSAHWRPGRSWILFVQQGFLRSRVEEQGRYDHFAEDRPAYTGFAYIQWSAATVWSLRLEGDWIGPRHCADATDEEDGLRRLPAQGRLHLRLSRDLSDVLGRTDLEGQLFLRLENVFDSRLDSQLGLPEGGRTLRGGIRLDLGA